MFEQSSQSLKVILGLLFVVLLGVLAFIFFTQNGGEKASTTTTTTTPAVVPSSADQVQAETPENTLSPAPVLSQEEIATKFKALRDQVDAGTLSPEEAKKQLETLNTPAVPVTAAPEVK